MCPGPSSSLGRWVAGLRETLHHPREWLSQPGLSRAHSCSCGPQLPRRAPCKRGKQPSTPSEQPWTFKPWNQELWSRPWLQHPPSSCLEQEQQRAPQAANSVISLRLKIETLPLFLSSWSIAQTASWIWNFGDVLKLSSKSALQGTIHFTPSFIIIIRFYQKEHAQKTSLLIAIEDVPNWILYLCVCVRILVMVDVYK